MELLNMMHTAAKAGATFEKMRTLFPQLDPIDLVEWMSANKYG